MMTFATSVGSIVPKTCLILSSGARVPFLAFLKIVSMTMLSSRSTSLPSFIFWTTAGSISISKLSPWDSNLATIASSRSTIGPLSRGQLLDVGLHFGVREPSEILVLLHEAYLDGLRVEVLLGGLRQGLEAQENRSVLGHVLLILLFEDIHDGVLARTYGSGLVRHERAARVRLEQMAALLVHPSHEERGPEGPHATVLRVVLLVVAQSLDQRLEVDLLRVSDLVDLGYDPRVVVPLLTASLAYSTWNSLPSGEKTVIALSYAICPGCIYLTPLEADIVTARCAVP